MVYDIYVCLGLLHFATPLVNNYVNSYTALSINSVVNIINLLNNLLWIVVYLIIPKWHNLFWDIPLGLSVGHYSCLVISCVCLWSIELISLSRMDYSEDRNSFVLTPPVYTHALLKKLVHFKYIDRSYISEVVQLWISESTVRFVF